MRQDSEPAENQSADDDRTLLQRVFGRGETRDRDTRDAEAAESEQVYRGTAAPVPPAGQPYPPQPRSGEPGGLPSRTAAQHEELDPTMAWQSPANRDEAVVRHTERYDQPMRPEQHPWSDQPVRPEPWQGTEDRPGPDDGPPAEDRTRGYEVPGPDAPVAVADAPVDPGDAPAVAYAPGHWTGAAVADQPAAHQQRPEVPHHRLDFGQFRHAVSSAPRSVVTMPLWVSSL